MLKVWMMADQLSVMWILFEAAPCFHQLHPAYDYDLEVIQCLKCDVHCTLCSERGSIPDDRKNYSFIYR